MASERSRALPILLLAVLAFVAATAALADADVVGSILAVWPLVAAAAGLSWLTLETWAPQGAPLAWLATVLTAFIAVQAAAIAPLGFLLADSLGNEGVWGWMTMSGLCFAGLLTYGRLKPTYQVEPIDALITWVVTIGSVLVAVVAFGLHFGNLVGAGLVALVNIVLLDRIGNALMLDEPGRGCAVAIRLFACATAIASELGWGMLRWPQLLAWLEQLG